MHIAIPARLDVSLRQSAASEGGLFVLMLSGRAWARIVPGIVTFPVGLLVLLPRAAREFTSQHYEGNGDDTERRLL